MKKQTLITDLIFCFGILNFGDLEDINDWFGNSEPW